MGGRRAGDCRGSTGGFGGVVEELIAGGSLVGGSVVLLLKLLRMVGVAIDGSFRGSATIGETIAHNKQRRVK